MADDIDMAQDRQQLMIDVALNEHKNKRNRDKQMREMAESKGLVLHCRYCESDLIGYDSHYCPIDVEDGYSCSAEHEKERQAEKRNNG